MDSGLDTGKDIAEFISYFITSLSLIGLWITYALSKKQIHFSTMEKCTNDFRNIVLLKDEKTQEDLIWQYIDLVNEEFFYLEKKYLPLEVCIEWVDGMIDYLPFYNEDGIYMGSTNLPLLNDESFLKVLMANYPRILRAVQLKKKINFDAIRISPLNEENRKIRFEERNKLIFLIISSLKIDFWSKKILQQKINRR
ncbi:hypothetical protein [Flavobacterium sp.]|uniref:hypothetical protein n=1 Tax=Flavobacterium sp. TaxID=239 RepID=UPI002607EF5F|nr:hypothetical protein [Flavobacterium sp.]